MTNTEAVNHLVRLARAIAAGKPSDIHQLVDSGTWLARAHGARPLGRRHLATGDLRVDLKHAVDGTCIARTAREVRAAIDQSALADHLVLKSVGLATLPATLPTDDATDVVVYRTGTMLGALLDAIGSGDEAKIQRATNRALEEPNTDNRAKYE